MFMMMVNYAKFNWVSKQESDTSDEQWPTYDPENELEL